MVTLTRTSEKIASSALKLFGHKPSFSITIHNSKEFEDVARTFERMGCLVTRTQEKKSLTIIPRPVEE